MQIGLIMASLNRVFLIGRLGKDPVIKHFSNENAIAEATLATDDSYRDKQGNKVEITDWHNIKFPFKRQAEIVEKYVKKGTLLHIDGKIKTRSYDDQAGQKRYITEIVVESFQILTPKGNETSGPASAQYQPSYSQEEQDSPLPTMQEDDLPF